MHIEFFDASLSKPSGYAGGFTLLFTSTPAYFLYFCNKDGSSSTFTANLPTETEKVWKITLTRTSDTRLVITCNHVEVVNTPISDATCDDSTGWSTFWSRKVAGIKFRQDDTASDFYSSFLPISLDTGKNSRI